MVSSSCLSRRISDIQRLDPGLGSRASTVGRRSYFLHSPDRTGPLSGTLLVLWHGAGGDVDHPTLVSTAKAFAHLGGHSVRARFPYRVEGRNAPDRMPKLIAAARTLLDELKANAMFAGARLLLGGRSMGGRMTTMLAAEGFEADGLILFSYPLHPVGKKDQLRAAHLADVRCPMLFLQGAKDKMADLELLHPVIDGLDRATLELFEKGDHGMKKVDPEEVAQAAVRWALARADMD